MKRFEIIGNRGRKYQRTVKRRYYSKKKGEWVTKVYHYEYGKQTKYTQRSSELVVQDGKITKYGEELQKALITRLGQSWEHQIGKMLNTKGDLKESTLLSKIQKTLEDREFGRPTQEKGSIRQYLYNMGGDLDELAEDMGIDPKILANKEYWIFQDSGKATFNYNGASYTFNFKYEDNKILWDRRK